MLALQKQRHNIQGARGDSLVEVLLAITALSSVLYIAWATVNRASQIGLNAQKRITMVNAVKEQAELVKAQYTTVPGSPITSDVAWGGVPPSPCASKNASGEPNPSDAFFWDGSAMVSGARSVGGSSRDKVWIQRVDGSDYFDYYVRACWQSTGGNQLDENSQLIVRLNKP